MKAVSDFQREQIIEMRKRRSAKEISKDLGVPESAVKRIQNTRCSILPTPKKREKIKIKTIQDTAKFICKILSELRNSKLSIESARIQLYCLQILITAQRYATIEEVEKRLKIIEEKMKCRR